MKLKNGAHYVVLRIAGSDHKGSTRYYEYLTTAGSNGKLFEWRACDWQDAFFFPTTMIELLPDLSKAHKNFSLENAEVCEVLLEPVGRFEGVWNV